MRTPAIIVVAVLPLALGYLGCGRRAEFFTLSPRARAGAQAPVGSRANLGLAVGPLQSRYLDRPEIVTRDGAHRLVLDDGYRWGGSLRSGILRVVADDLGVPLGTTRVAVYPEEPRFPVDYRILLDVREFEGTPGKSVRLRARWSVLAGTNGKALPVDASDIDQAVASASWEEFIAAHAAALGAMTREIAARLAELSAREVVRAIPNGRLGRLAARRASARCHACCGSRAGSRAELCPSTAGMPG
jgi:uncharacterized lipoprotein YmbA